MAEIARINAALLPGAPAFSDNFILDIDLDYFNTAKSITPDHRSVFYDLIRRCIGITIAMESYYVIRKTWAYQQRHCNRVPVELLQEALGHSSGQITLAYA
jgi:integrase